MPSRNLSAAAAALALFTLAQTATAYDWEADINIAKPDESSDPIYHGTLNYFFAPVTHGTSTPWAEIPFTERISELSLGAAYSKTDTDFGLKSEGKIYAFGYNRRQATSPHAFSGVLGYFEHEILFPRLDYANGFPVTILERMSEKQYSYGAEYRYYLKENWDIGAGLTLDESSFQDVYNLRFSTNRLWDLGNQTWAGVRASIAFAKSKSMFGDYSNIHFSLEGRYYFSEKTGVSAEVKIPDSGKPRSAEVSIQHYLTDSAFIALGYSYTELAASRSAIGPDGNLAFSDSTSTVQAKLGLRF